MYIFHHPRSNPVYAFDVGQSFSFALRHAGLKPCPTENIEKFKIPFQKNR